MTINAAQTLAVSGSGLTTQNRIIIIASSGVCGDGLNGMSTAVISAPGTPSGTSTTMIYSSVKLNALGDFSVCWCHAPSCTLVDYATRIGSLNVAGPTLTNSFAIMQHTQQTLTVAGSRLSTANRLKIISSSGTCGSSGSDAVVSGAPGTPTGTDSAMTFANVVISSVATLKVCWWDGQVGSDVIASYATDIGDLAVGGPTPGQSFDVVLSTASSLIVNGTYLSTQNRLKVDSSL